MDQEGDGQGGGGMNGTIYRQTMTLRVVRDDHYFAGFSADFRAPDRLQQAWVGDDGTVEWRDVEVVGASKIKVET